jgi:hypothetical protein
MSKLDQEIRQHEHAASPNSLDDLEAVATEWHVRSEILPADKDMVKQTSDGLACIVGAEGKMYNCGRRAGTYVVGLETSSTRQLDRNELVRLTCESGLVFEEPAHIESVELRDSHQRILTVLAT